MQRQTAYSIVFGFVLMFFSPGMAAQNEIDYPVCVSTDAAGQIIITLEEPYTALFTSTNLNGPYNPVMPADTTINGNSIIFNNFNGFNEIHWFYFSSPTFTDTIANIRLTVDAQNDGGIAVLFWNIPFTPSSAIPDGPGKFLVMREYPLGTWSVLSEVALNINSYRDTIAICDDTLNYKIVIPVSDASGPDCDFSSDTEGDNFNNNIAPDIPAILSVSVDETTGLAVISWVPPPQPDLNGYVVAEDIGGASIAIDTIYDKTAVLYFDPNSDTQNQVHRYGIAAFDTCINPLTGFFYISPPTALPEFHNTILLETEVFGCDTLIKLKWNKYNNWPAGVNRYEIMANIDGSPWQTIKQQGPQDTAFIHAHLEPDREYCYKIRAVDGTGQRESFSNVSCRVMQYPKSPDVVYMSAVYSDFGDDNKIYLKLHVSTEEGVDIQGFAFEGSYPNGSGFINIGAVGYTGNDTYVLYDTTATSDIGEIWYRARVIDGCGFSGKYSNEINSVFLEVITDDQEAINTLVWNDAIGRAGEISGYELFRVNKVSGDIVSGFYNAGPGENFYDDDLGDLWEEDGGYCYIVVPVEVNNPWVADTSTSNLACGTVKPRIWIPNSYVVDGVSPPFGPVVAYADVSDYRMRIINRLGTVLFTSEDVAKGWDGYYNGKPVSDGVYVYVIELRDGTGNYILERGTVTVFSHE